MEKSCPAESSGKKLSSSVQWKKVVQQSPGWKNLSSRVQAGQWKSGTTCTQPAGETTLRFEDLKLCILDESTLRTHLKMHNEEKLSSRVHIGQWKINEGVVHNQLVRKQIAPTSTKEKLQF